MWARRSADQAISNEAYEGVIRPALRPTVTAASNATSRLRARFLSPALRAACAAPRIASSGPWRTGAILPVATPSLTAATRFAGEAARTWNVNDVELVLPALSVAAI